MPGLFSSNFPDQVSSAIAQSVWIILQSPVPLILIKFSILVLENLSTYTNLGFGKSTIVSIANFYIETISVAGVAGIRTANITTNFKKIIAVTLTPYITQGQNDPSLMTQVAHNSYNYVLENKKINIYATGSQTIEVTIFGLV